MTSIYLIKKGMAAGYVGVAENFQPDPNVKMLRVIIYDNVFEEMRRVHQPFPNEDLEEKSIEALAASFNKMAFILAKITNAMGKLNDPE